MNRKDKLDKLDELEEQIADFRHEIAIEETALLFEFRDGPDGDSMSAMEVHRWLSTTDWDDLTKTSESCILPIATTSAAAPYGLVVDFRFLVTDKDLAMRVARRFGWSIHEFRFRLEVQEQIEDFAPWRSETK